MEVKRRLKKEGRELNGIVEGFKKRENRKVKAGFQKISTALVCSIGWKDISGQEEWPYLNPGNQD